MILVMIPLCKLHLPVPLSKGINTAYLESGQNRQTGITRRNHAALTPAGLLGLFLGIPEALEEEDARNEMMEGWLRQPNISKNWSAGFRTWYS